MAFYASSRAALQGSRLGPPGHLRCPAPRSRPPCRARTTAPAGPPPGRSALRLEPERPRGRRRSFRILSKWRVQSWRGRRKPGDWKPDSDLTGLLPGTPAQDPRHVDRGGLRGAAGALGVRGGAQGAQGPWEAGRRGTCQQACPLPDLVTSPWKYC